MKKHILGIISAMTVAIIVFCTISCRHYDWNLGESPDPIPEKTPLEIKLIEAPKWINTDWPENIKIYSNKATTLNYQLSGGKGEITVGDTTITEQAKEIQIQKGENSISFKTHEKKESIALYLSFIALEPNLIGEKEEIKIKIWTYNVKTDFAVELTHDTPDSLFLQYKPVALRINIKAKAGADTSGSYTYEYEIIKGSALITTNGPAPTGSNIAPKEKRFMQLNDTPILYVTPLKDEQTWIRVIVRKIFGNKDFTGDYLKMDYINPRGKPGLDVSISNLGTTGNLMRCLIGEDKIKYCRGDRLLYYFDQYRKYNTPGSCYRTGVEENTKVKHRVYIKQQNYYVPDQKYRLLIQVDSADLIVDRELSITPYHGQTNLIDYDALIGAGHYDYSGNVYLDFDINMPSHSYIYLNGEDDSKLSWIQLRAIALNEAATTAAGYSTFELVFAKFSSCK